MLIQNSLFKLSFTKAGILNLIIYTSKSFIDNALKWLSENPRLRISQPKIIIYYVQLDKHT